MIQSLVYSQVSVVGWLADWQQRLGLTTFRGIITPIDPMQVTGEDGLPGAELVGVVVEDRCFTILHTRPLDISDVIHELLHVAHPEWPHDCVDFWTERLLQNPAFVCLVSKEPEEI